MKKTIKVILIAVTLFMPAGCATLETAANIYSKNSLVAGLAIQIATAKLIELSRSKGERAQAANDTIRIAEEIRKYANLGDVIIVSELEAYVKRLIRRENFEPSTELLGFLLVDTIKIQIDSRVSDDVLDENAKIFLSSVITNIIGASNIYIE